MSSPFAPCFIVAILMMASANAQHLNPQSKEFRKLDSTNGVIGALHQSKNITTLKSFYKEDVILMPEYYEALYTRTDAFNYYSQWFNATNTIIFNKKIVDLFAAGDYLIETGKFLKQYTVNDTPYIYDGKYLNVWQKDRTGQLKIVSEIWGSDTSISRNVFSFIKKIKPASFEEPANNSILQEVTSRNNRIAQLVTTREGEKHALEFFTKDAIYLTYDNPMFIGFDAIRTYFSAHEKPGDVTVNNISLNTSRLIGLGQTVIEYAYYSIDVSWDSGGGVFTGKSVNVWRREPTGILMLYRQMVNHD